MDKSKAEGNLHIDKFKSQVDLLCNPYTHPVYLSLLDDTGGDLLLIKGLKEGLNATIKKHLPSPPPQRPHSKNTAKLREKLTKATLTIDLTSKKNQGGLEFKALEENLLGIVTPHNISNNASLRELIGALRGDLTDCFSKYRNLKKEHIQAIIRREPKIAQEKESTPEGNEQTSGKSLWDPLTPKDTKYPLEKRCALLDDIIRDLWIPFSKSLLEGEFLKDTEYSPKLQDIVKKIRITYDSTHPEEVVYLHPILPRIYTLCQELSYMCQRVQIQINASSGRKVFHAPVSDLARKPYKGGESSGEILKAKHFHDLAANLIEMTRIDISGVIGAQAISCLLLLHKQCSLLIKNEESDLLDFPWNVGIKEIFLAIRAKTSLLLFQSFYKPYVTTETHTLNIPKSIANPYQRVKGLEILYEGENYLIGGSAENKLLQEQIDEFKSLSSATITTDKKYSQEDILRYDQYIQRGVEGRKKAPEDEEERAKLLKNLLNNLKEAQEQHHICHLPLDILLSLMKELSAMKENDQKKEGGERKHNNSKYTKAMGHLLKCFSERLQSYKDFVAAEQKRYQYADSFYQVEGTSLRIFISSFGCKLLHTQALETEAYPKHNRFYREWLSEAQEETMATAIEVAQTAEAASSEAAEASKKAAAASDVAQQSSKQTKEGLRQMNATKLQMDTSKYEIDKKISALMIDTRKEAISLLSVFVALITFISGGITILKGVNSLADYLILTGTLYIFVASIIGFLYFKSIEGDQQEEGEEEVEKKGEEDQQEEGEEEVGKKGEEDQQESKPSNSTDKKQKKSKDKSITSLWISTALAATLIVTGLYMKFTGVGTEEGSGSLEMNYEAGSIRQVFPSRGQTTDPLTPTDTESGNANMGEEGKREKKPENPPTSTSRKDHPLPMNHR